MLVDRAYKAFSARNAAKAVVYLGISAIALIVSAVLSYIRTEAGAAMLGHVTFMALAAILMVVGLSFLHKARMYREKTKRYLALRSGKRSQEVNG